jgi:hypothetical protein
MTPGKSLEIKDGTTAAAFAYRKIALMRRRSLDA